MKINRNPFYSLREAGRILDIPVSSLVYYRDRFLKYIPFTIGPAGRNKYTDKSLEVFKIIRQRFRQKQSWEQIEEELAASFPSAKHPSAPKIEKTSIQLETVSENRELLREIAASLKQIATSLDTHNTMREEIHHIAQELKAFRLEKRQMDEQYLDQFQRLEQVLEKSRIEQDGFQQTQTDNKQRTAKKPDARFLRNPLTVHFPPDRYFGIKDSRNTTLNFQQLIETIKQYVKKPQKVLFSWQAGNKAWTLLATIKQPAVNKKKTLIWVAQSTVTHQNNVVTEIVRMNIEGKDLTRDEMLQFFKLLKNNVTQWGKPT